jgi:predicted nucleic acid-binding protein
MPPQRTIIVDTNRILANIYRQAAGQHEAAMAGTVPFREQERQETLREALWVPRKLEVLAEKSLTASERIRHQQAMRKLEADGLVILDTVFVRLTEAGKALAKQLTNQDSTPTEPATN